MPSELPTFPFADELIDAVDARLLECLVLDARQSLRQLGRLLEVSEHTVRARLRRLEETGLVRIAAQVDQHVVEATSESAFVALRTRNARVPSIIESLTELPAVRSLDRTVGEFSVLVEATALSRRELAAVVDRIRSSPEVDRSESWLVAHHELGAFPWARFAS